MGLAGWRRAGEGMTYRFGDKRTLRSMKSAIKVVPGLVLGTDSHEIPRG